MATEMKMPQLGESVTEGTITKWLVKPGDMVKKYEPIAEVMTDKVNAEVPSSYTGTLKELLVQEDETVSVGTVICSVETAEATDQALKAVETVKEDKPDATVSEEKDLSQKNRYSPAVLKLSQEHSIDLTRVEGTGKSGRITRKDLEKMISVGGQTQTTPEEVPSKQVAREEAPIRSQETVTSTGDIEIPVTGIRKAIAANMVRSKHEAPHAWTMVEVDVTRLVQHRNKVKADFKAKEGYNLTFLPFFMKAIVEALKEFPEVNSMWAGDKIIRKKDINISMAVSTDDALYVPVIHQADDKSIKGLAKSIHELAGKVRTGKLSSADSQGGTFTINNTGSFGSIQSAPIINYPQAAILSIESIVKRPVVIEQPEGDSIAIRHMVNLCLSLDHRILDGLVCGQFLASIKKKLEQFSAE
ncbi:dihydrolipoamide acetyltransferase family protein [Alkalicoccobacillus murimartini]|uniref:Dihydrolipoamide acetyltransferase component of pyruvate dehydrogenase complex n=1 Tax=Alkalicoccobacillus murimartini TaxID=171685 RepID=A0ABT9YMP7_9BACI|nr:dihydrolipoamide acetyltransferase family protein [Alkalicoccobacillus murimartini]MDQ0208914.1 2-oxoisovalerate dehydrogenase E2 component (dihydrolipoyl transacylase) [Alkalicoccobacillus murimartini]